MKTLSAIHCAALLLVFASCCAERADADEVTGAVYRFNYTGEVFADVNGGMQRGAVFTGLLQATLDWHVASWTAHGDAYMPHGDSLTQHDVGDFSVASNIDAVHQLRLHELWVQRKIGPASVRLGLLSADTEFWGSDTGAIFVNSAFGAPSVVSGNLPHPSIFPQGVLGARAQFDLAKSDTLRIAVLDGDGGDQASVNRHGLHIDLKQGALLVVEDQHLFGKVTSPTASARLGAYFHTGDFTDIHGAVVHGNWGLLGVIDRTINERFVWFGRVAIAEHDRSTVPWAVETGFNLGAVFAPRNTLGLAVAYVDLNGGFRNLDNPLGLRHEIIVESTLNVPLDERITVQPDLQYIIDPGGTSIGRNALVVGLRVNVALGR
ncbi:MAG: carbohydrate porin [Lysobacteraceae bacterium]